MDIVPDRLVAALAGHYRIEREIGAGGMATVYLAEDLKHNRQVAIKVLRPELSAALGGGRFEDEVQIAAGLHHPHIVPLHDSGEADGFLYYVMPFVEGHSLRERLHGKEPMPTQEIARLLSEVAEALAYAHDKGVVHRDIKPENIMISGRHASVMDFGIAKAISDAGERRSSTSIGLALGTPAYMAPEQAVADPSLDHRADLYALGVVAYEMLAGHPPFHTGSTQQVLAAHLNSVPEPVGNLRTNMPPGLATVVMKALAKAPGDRWQTAEAMRAQLEPLLNSSSSGMTPTVMVGAARRNNRVRRGAIVAILAGALVSVGVVTWHRSQGSRPAFAANAANAANAAATSTATVPALDGSVTTTAVTSTIPDLASDPSIAVLPFENMSSDKEQTYFSDGISEELLNLLARVPKLRVISRTSSFAFKGKEVGIQEIARQLHVAAVLEGSVRKSGDTVRITTQLIRATDGSHLWSATYDRKLDDIFKVQDEIAATVVAKLKITLLGAAPTVRPVNPRAYPLLLQAKAMADNNSKASREGALAMYQRVLLVSPDEPRAWAGLARTYSNMGIFGDRLTREVLPLAKAAAERAIAIDPSYGLPHAYLARMASDFDNDLPTAAREMQRAMELDPTDASILNNAAGVLASMGRVDESATIFKYLAAHDPASAVIQGNLGATLYSAGRCDEADVANRTTLALSPGFTSAHFLLGMCELFRKHPDRAIAEMQAEPDDMSRLSGLAIAYWSRGDKTQSDAWLAQLLRQHGTDGTFLIAAVYAWRGDADATFTWLDKAVALKDPNLAVIHVEPSFQSVHGDARWLPFLRRIGRAPEQLAKVPFKVTLPK